MISSIILFAALGMTPNDDMTLVFVAGFNGVTGSDCIFLTEMSKSTLEVKQVLAKRDGNRLYVLTFPDQVQSGSLLWTGPAGDTLMTCGVIAESQFIVFRPTATYPIAPLVMGKTNESFLLTTGTTFEGLKNPLSALILTRTEVFSARYDQIGTIFVRKTEDFDTATPISVILYDKNGQKWLYSCLSDGKYLRFDSHKSPRGPL